MLTYARLKMLECFKVWSKLGLEPEPHQNDEDSQTVLKSKSGIVLLAL
jgi:hypothetical protein